MNNGSPSATPDYAPVHRVGKREPKWLSSRDVREAIVSIVNERGNSAKAIGWDLIGAINKLEEDAPEPSPNEHNSGEV